MLNLHSVKAISGRVLTIKYISYPRADLNTVTSLGLAIYPSEAIVRVLFAFDSIGDNCEFAVLI